ncbi:MAG TPA: DUF1415 domain-containing protein [Rhodoferax sp.]|jgi:hypothetical protein|nr:DUF1415 domain-containing protein [Rhodoferax sp.]HPW83714.1 DUF1415 domain-containing protein [Rhodoferax sp.]HQC85366.1 DUF1415 domain-containing protein [Rhodoferax sp.]HQY76979.1 DUF1415 domain-containing protein [Rhodoferax sp.]
MTSQSRSSDEQMLSLTVRWLERAVIGLNLCPFAKSVHVKGQIHYRLSHATQKQELLQVLQEELQALQATDPAVRDTTLLILADCFPDFLDFNDFLQDADDVLYTLGLDGTLQIASFHPRFQFAGTTEDDITNFTNRAPFPVLHLIREASIARAVEAFPDAEMIYEKNMRTLEDLGRAGWKELGLEIEREQDAERQA